MEMLSLLLDVSLIGLLLVGIRYAVKLSRQLGEMRQARAEMERFVFDFSAAINRAETGVRNLKNTARSSGDDLEQLIEKGQMLRDELTFLTESADQVANRLSSAATTATRGSDKPAQQVSAAKPASAAPRPATAASPKPAAAPTAQPPKDKATVALEKQKALLEEVKNIAAGTAQTKSAAERDLLRVLEKLG